MKSTYLKSRLLVATLVLGVGVAVFFFSALTPWLSAFDRSCVRAASSSDKLVYDHDATSDTISAHTLAIQPAKARDFRLVAVTDDPDHIFEHTPPSPLDYAVILESLHNREYNSVVLTTRMTWDEQPGLEAKGLSSRLALFNKAVIALPVTRGATAQALPAALRRALIPFSRITGNHQLIPTVNQVTLPSHADGAAQTLAGFHRIESAPSSPDHIPMLAHWQGQGLIPSLELLAIMSVYDVLPAALIIHCGKHIRLGSLGPVIPIDVYGQTSFPAKSVSPTDNALPPLIAAQVIGEPPTPPAPQPKQVALIHATGATTSATNTLSPTRISILLTLAKTFLIPEKTTRYQRLPLAAEIAVLLAITLAATWFAGFSPGNRYFALAITASLLFPLLLALMDITHHWFALSAPLAALTSACLIPSPRRKQTSPGQAYHTTDTKPVIRA